MSGGGPPGDGSPQAAPVLGMPGITALPTSPKLEGVKMKEVMHRDPNGDSSVTSPMFASDKSEDPNDVHNKSDNTDRPSLSASSPTGSWRSKRAMTQAPQATGVAPSLSDYAGDLNITETRLKLSGNLSPVSLMSGKVGASPFDVNKIEPVLDPPPHILQKYLTVGEDIRTFNSPPGKRPDLVAIWRYKMIFVGAGEAGKTSLRKCFASNPLFFKNLPEVGTTTGIDIQRHRVKVSDQRDSIIDIEVHDFAGQEVYHSHSLFLSNRTLFVFVWNMSNVEQTFDDYGISSDEENRLRQWADVVQAKCPGAPMVVIGTHKDELRDPSRKTVVLILNKVCRAISEYIDTFQPAQGIRNIFVGGSFCVSCKSRTVTPENQGGPTKMKELFQYLGDLCSKYATTDSLYPQGAVPRYVVHLIATLEKLKAEMNTVVLPMKAYNSLTKQLGIPKELLHKVTTMLHDWGVLYLFDKQATKLGRTDCVFLHPVWLSQMVSVVFTYAHACIAPVHERLTMEVELIDLNVCDLVEPTKLILEGVLSTILAKVLFARVLQLLKRQVTDQNIDICFTMLANLDLCYKNTYIPEEGPHLSNRSISSRSPNYQYYIPSIFPRAMPPDMPVHISRLMRNKGVHQLFNLCPFPKEFVHMLHCRTNHLMMRLQVDAPCPDRDPPNRKVQNNWRDGLWLAGGGGEGHDLGLGPLRAFVACDLEARRIDVWAVSPGDSDPRIMKAKELCRHVEEAIKDLATKFPGITLSEKFVVDKVNPALEDESFRSLTSAMKPVEVEFLAKSLGFEPTATQKSTLDEMMSVCNEDRATPPPDMKVSLLLDKLIKACMLQDPVIVQINPLQNDQNDDDEE